MRSGNCVGLRLQHVCMPAYVFQGAQVMSAFDGSYDKDQTDFTALTKTNGLYKIFGLQ